MTLQSVYDALSEAKKFVSLANRLTASSTNMKMEGSFFASKESGAIKRSSLDLTRALARMRKP
jgi:hypothetical protein